MSRIALKKWRGTSGSPLVSTTSATLSATRAISVHDGATADPRPIVRTLVRRDFLVHVTLEQLT